MRIYWIQTFWFGLMLAAGTTQQYETKKQQEVQIRAPLNSQWTVTVIPSVSYSKKKNGTAHSSCLRFVNIVKTTNRTNLLCIVNN